MRLLLLAGLALICAGCEHHEASVEFRPTASFQEVMLSIIDPVADQLWDSVSTEITKSGVEEKQPRTDEEWAAVRHQAVTLSEAANLLLIEGRPLAAPGQALDNKADYLNPEEIGKAIDRDRPTFVARVREFQDAAALAVVAADARTPQGVVEAGARIQQACEQCHLRYWYPNGGPPPASAIAGKSGTAG